MYLALTGMFRAKWTAEIHEEWMAALLEKRPDLSREKLERTRELMDKHAIDALVNRLRGPDSKSVPKPTGFGTSLLCPV